MSWASEEILDVMWRLAAVGTDVETSVLLYAALIGAYEFSISGSYLREGGAFLPGQFFSESLIGCGRPSNTILFF